VDGDCKGDGWKLLRTSLVMDMFDISKVHAVAECH
jgi:hypothetical protein